MASVNTLMLLVSLMGMISFLFLSLAACNDKANLKRTLSSPSFLICFETPAVETVILRGLINKPSSAEMRSTALSTLS